MRPERRCRLPVVAQPPCQAPPSGLDTEEVLSWEDHGLTLSHRSCDSAWSTPAVPWLGFGLKPSVHSSLLSLPATLLCTEVWDRGPIQAVAPQAGPGRGHRAVWCETRATVWTRRPALSRPQRHEDPLIGHVGSVACLAG